MRLRIEVVMSHCRRLAEIRLWAERVRVLFRFHPSILEPDFDLALAELQRLRNFHATPTRQIFIAIELVLQLQRLFATVGLACAFLLARDHCRK